MGIRDLMPSAGGVTRISIPHIIFAKINTGELGGSLPARET